MTELQQESGGRPLSRRQALKGVAGVGAVVWTVPTLQVITMSAAHADSPSVPPGQTPPPATQTPPPATQTAPPPATQTPPPATQTATPPATQTATPPSTSPTQTSAASPSPTDTSVGVLGVKNSRSSTTTTEVAPTAAGVLPHTGVGDGTFKAGIAGAAAIGLGAAIMRATRQEADAADTDS